MIVTQQMQELKTIYFWTSKQPFSPMEQNLWMKGINDSKIAIRSMVILNQYFIFIQINSYLPAHESVQKILAQLK